MAYSPGFTVVHQGTWLAIEKIYIYTHYSICVFLDTPVPIILDHIVSFQHQTPMYFYLYEPSLCSQVNIVLLNLLQWCELHIWTLWRGFTLVVYGVPVKGKPGIESSGFWDHGGFMACPLLLTPFITQPSCWFSSGPSQQALAQEKDCGQRGFGQRRSKVYSFSAAAICASSTTYFKPCVTPQILWVPVKPAGPDLVRSLVYVWAE